MAPFPEEVDVFTIPHSRMKQLVQIYSQKLTNTNFQNDCDFQGLLNDLHATFTEFKTHETIENEEILRRLNRKLKALSITNAAVCACHSDNRLSAMLDLLHDGYRANRKTLADRLNFATLLQQALEEFTNKFLPHMQEEEEVFQPLLIKYFTYDELKKLKEIVINKHKHWKEQMLAQCFVEDQNSGTLPPDEKEDTESEKQDIAEKFHLETLEKDEEKCATSEESASIARLPPELLVEIFSYLGPRDLGRCAQVCQQWSEQAKDPSLWKHIQPLRWLHGDWSFSREIGCREEPAEKVPLIDQVLITYKENDWSPCRDEDADIDESSDSDSGSISSTAEPEQSWLSQEREAHCLNTITNQLLPRIGRGVEVLDLSRSSVLGNRMLRKMLYSCPNLRHLSLAYTHVSDACFKGLNGCLTKLESINLSGCVNISDIGLERFACSLVPEGTMEYYVRNYSDSECQEAEVVLHSSSLSDCASSQSCGLGSQCCQRRRANEVRKDSPELCPMDYDCDSATVRSIESCHMTKLTSSASGFGGAVLRPLSNQSMDIDKDSDDCDADDAIPKARLKYLCLSGLSLLTAYGLSSLVDIGGLPHLEFLDLSGCFQLTGTSINDLVNTTPFLTPPKLFYCDNITDGPFALEASGCRNLESACRMCCRNAK